MYGNGHFIHFFCEDYLAESNDIIVLTAIEHLIRLFSAYICIADYEKKKYLSYVLHTTTNLVYIVNLKVLD